MTTVQPVRTVDRLDADQVTEVLALAVAAAGADGVYPFSEDVALRVRGGDAPPGGVHLLSHGPGDALAGYAWLDPAESGELVVHPQARRRGHGTALLAAAAVAAGGAPLRFWAHGDDPKAKEFALGAGFTRTRVLWQMRRSLAEPLPVVPLPEGLTLRTFRPGADEQRWLELNARAFADHPEQGRWTDADLRLRQDELWFDPDGFLLAVDVADRLAGFHWTKVHPAAGNDPPIGEIYVLGVDPDGHRRGLGRALSVAGLAYLAGRGLTEAMLYVDADNTPAVGLYERLGFTVWSTDILYARPA